MSQFKNLLTSSLGVGKIPLAPGTFGSLIALPLGIGIYGLTGLWQAVLAASIVLFFLGIWACQGLTEEDPAWVTIDETAAQLLVLACLPQNVLAAGLGFVLFRLFDIWKPFPVGWIDKKLHGAWGIMLDDIAAAILAITAYYGGAYGTGVL